MSRYVFKLVLAGDGATGKTALLQRLTQDRPSPVYTPTVGVDFRYHPLYLDNETPALLQIWDTSGQERFRRVALAYFRNCDGAVILYDVCNRSTFDHVKAWHAAIVGSSPSEHRPVVLVGNKADSGGLSRRQVTLTEAQELADKLGAAYFETSAWTGEGVERVFTRLAAHLVEGCQRRPPRAATQDGVELRAVAATGGGGGACMC